MTEDYQSFRTAGFYGVFHDTNLGRAECTSVEKKRLQIDSYLNPMLKMFTIQFDAAGIYKVGTRTQQFHVSFEEMMSFTGGIIGLLEYGLAWKVLKGSIGRTRHRLWHHPGSSIDTQPAIWIDNSGPVLYELRHGLEYLRICPEELETSRLGKAIKLYWDGGMTGLKTSWVVRMVIEAFFVGLWRNLLRRLKKRSF